MKILFVLVPLGACTLSLLAMTGYTYAAQITVPIKGPRDNSLSKEILE